MRLLLSGWREELKASERAVKEAENHTILSGVAKNLPALVQCKKILGEDPLFLLLTTHSPGFSALTMKNMLQIYLVEEGAGIFSTDEMYIYDTGSDLHLPNGFYARWQIK